MEASQQSSLFFLGDSEMGTLIKKYDWSKTPVGAIDTWPQSLRTTLSIMLRSKFPMLIWWGNDLIQFYNDAYRPSLGVNGKHPTALGQRGEDCWQEIWDFIKPIIDNVRAGGEANWNEDQLLPIYRNGKLEDVYWTFSYSAVFDEAETIAGVFVTCTETTEKVLSLARQQFYSERFQNLIREATIGIIVLQGRDMVVEIVNEPYGKLIGTKPADLIGKPLFNIIPQAKETFYPMLIKVLETGEPIYLYDTPYFVQVDDKEISGFLNVIYQAYREVDGNITGVMAIVQDVSEQVKARKDIADNEEELRFAIDASELGTFDLNPFTNKFKGNGRLKEWFGLLPDEDIPLPTALGVIIDKDRARVITEIEKALQYELGGDYNIDYTIINPITGAERIVRAKGKATFNDDKKPYRFNGTVQDITNEIKFKQALEDQRTALQNALDIAKLGTYKFDFKTGLIEYSDNLQQLFGLHSAHESKNELIKKIVPEDLVKIQTRLASIHADTSNNTYDLSFKIQPQINVIKYVHAVGKTEFENDKPTYLNGIIHDVTAEKHATLKLEDSEKNLRNIIEQAPVGMVFFRGKDFKVEVVNGAILENWNRKLEEVQDKNLLDFLPEIASQGFAALLTKVYTTGEQYAANEMPVNFIRNDRSETFYRSFTFNAYHEFDGEITGVLVVSTDVTNEVNAKKLIKRNELFASKIIQSSLTAQCVWEGYDMVFTMVNEKMLEILGRDQSIIGMKYMDAIPELQNTPLMKRLHHVLATGETFEQPEEEFTLIRNGKPYTGIFTYTYQALADSSGENYAVICTCYEISDQIRARKEIEHFSTELAKQVVERTIDLQRSNEDLLRFAHVASHDLKEPVRKIKTFANRLQTDVNESLSDKGQSYLDKIQHAADRMYNMIDGVLTYSEINTPDQMTEVINLQEIISSIEKDLEVPIQTKNVTIVKGFLPSIEGAPILIHQLFYNLISNAIKFARPTVDLIITITSAIIEVEGKELAKIVISDNGIGFDQAYAKKIFNTFTRLHSKDAFEGTGLGLALCERIVSRHHGTIEAIGTPNAGADFIVAIPLKQIDFI